jgi:D-alanyl-D-alanine carboxypeptidase
MKSRMILKMLAFALIISGALLHAQVPIALQTRLQDTIHAMHLQTQARGISVAVHYKGLGTWTAAVGQSAQGQSLQPNMLIGIGSNTKTFTSVILLKLLEGGQVNLSDTLGTWLQGYPNIAGDITLHQIMNHTSGIYDITENVTLWDSVNSNLSRIWTKQEILQGYVLAPNFAPGSNWSYSNTNYLILGQILEQITGRALHELIRDSILTPLGLTHTYFPPYEIATDPYAHFWSDIDGDGFLDDAADWSNNSQSIIPYEINSLPDGAGAMVSTPEDNVLFWKALLSGQLLAPNTLQQIMCDFVPTNGDYLSLGMVGYGLGIIQYLPSVGDTTLSHDGDWFGQINRNLSDTLNDIYISVFSNQDSVEMLPVLDALYKVALEYGTVAIAPQLNAAAITYELYPNPAQATVHLQAKGQTMKQIQIWDAQGRLMKAVDCPNISTTTFSVTDLPNGLYSLRVDGRALSGKLLVQHE